MMSHSDQNLDYGLRKGDPDRFAVRIEFCRDPEGSGLDAEDLLSWGRLQIWAGGRNLCQHHVDGVPFAEVTWSLLPVLEWLARDWDAIFHEQKLPAADPGGWAGPAMLRLNAPARFERRGAWDDEAAGRTDAWARRHSLMFHRHGGLFPDVWIRRFGSLAEVSWTDLVPAGAPAGFQFSNGSGGLALPLDDVAHPLGSLLEDSVAAMRRALPGSVRLDALARSIGGLRIPDRRPRRVGILAGLGSSPEDWQRRWEDLVERLQARLPGQADLVRSLFHPVSGPDLYVGGECAGALMFASVAPDLNEQDALDLASLMIDQAGEEGSDGLADFVRPAPLNRSLPPWDEGYQLASEWMEAIGWAPEAGFVDVEADLVRFGVVVRDIRLVNREIGGVSIARGPAPPRVAVNLAHPRNAYASGRRFTLAHELCHLLFDRDQAIGLQIASGPWAPADLERRANAFAAAVLMPDALIDRVAGRLGLQFDSVTRADVYRLCEVMQVSPSAALAHLQNRGWITETQRESLLAEHERARLMEE